MTTLYVQYCSRKKLACSEAADKDVVLCLQDSALIVPTECTTPSEGTYVGAFAEATICQWYSTGDCNGIFVYTFSYDDAILADSEVPLQPADISGVFCRDCMTSYYDYKVGSEVYLKDEDDGSQTLISQHLCEYPIDVTNRTGIADVASQAALALPATGNVFNITGTTNITSIGTTLSTGRVVILKFAGILTVTDGSNLKLAGNFVTTADDTLTLVGDGTNWYEVARSTN